MALLRNTLFLALLLLFSFKFARCQETEQSWNAETGESPLETVHEEAVIEICEEMPIIEEEVEIVTIGLEECPRFIEETEVNGHWMTFHPCCVSSESVCGTSYEPVCIEKKTCEADHCRYHYETVGNVCKACRGNNDWQYSVGKCPWEKNTYYFRH